MEKFTASNGVRIEVFERGDKRFLVGETQESPQHMRMIEATASEEGMAALREFFQAERDQELGRWRWSENPQYVVYPIEDQDGVWVLNETLARGEYVDRSVAERTTSSGTLARQAARAYFAAHLEPKPWHEAREGEVWVLTTSGVDSRWNPTAFRVASMSDGELGFFPLEPDYSVSYLGVKAGAITGARRIYPECSS